MSSRPFPYYRTLTPDRGSAASPSDPFGDAARREAQSRATAAATAEAQRLAARTAVELVQVEPFTEAELHALRDLIQYGRRGPGLRSAVLKIGVRAAAEHRAELAAALHGRAGHGN